MEFRNYTFEFEAHQGGPNYQQIRFGFSKPIAQATAILQGYAVRFVDGDHHFGQLQIKLDTAIVNNAPDGPEVVVTGTFALRDWSGNWDDRYAGSVNFCLIATEQSPFRPPFLASAVG
jgi:hypothetical protein